MRFQGRSPGGGAYALPITVKLFPSGNPTPLVFTPMTDPQGAFVIEGIAPGTYDVEVKQAEALSRKATGAVFAADAVVTLSLGTLPTGDSDDNNLVDIVDFSLLRSTFGASATCGTAGSPPPTCADYDGSSLIDIVDFSLLRSSFGQAGPLAPSTDPSDAAPPLDPTVAAQLCAATSFLYTGATSVQTGVAPGVIKCLQVSVVRGRVLSMAGQGLAGVTAQILNHPEYGQTLTRTDGQYDLAVNGGSQLTLSLGRTGFISAQRTVSTQQQQSTVLPDVALVAYDSQVTTIDLNGGGTLVHQGSSVTDQDGTRHATLMFRPGTVTVAAPPSLTTQTALTTINVRATEFTVGAMGPRAMPAQLPPNSGYTYAVELSADEAVAVGGSVSFSSKVSLFVDNFLGFPVGGVVPGGSYDTQQAQWTPHDNGRVIKIVSISGGRADLDVTGDGVADTGAALIDIGIDDPDRIALAGLYPVGTSLWYVGMYHFSSWDMNWPAGFPADAAGPQVPSSNPSTTDCPPTRTGSIIDCETQALGEELGIIGTPYNLVYRSDRVPGRTEAYSVNIPVTGPTVPASLVRTDLVITVMGRQFTASLPHGTNQSYRFTWDGKDAYGRLAQGVQPITAKICYVYPPQYLPPAQAGLAFGAFSSANAGASYIGVHRGDATICQDWTGDVGVFDARGVGLGGWTLDVHHTYDPISHTLFRGDGRHVSAKAASMSAIKTVAGSDNTCNQNSCEGGPATSAFLLDPEDVAVAPDGTFYVSDRLDHRVP